MTIITITPDGNTPTPADGSMAIAVHGAMVINAGAGDIIQGPPGGPGRVVYTGASWPARITDPDPIFWISTRHPSAPKPPMVEGDMWVRHPDAEVAP